MHCLEMLTKAFLNHKLGSIKHLRVELFWKEDREWTIWTSKSSERDSYTAQLTLHHILLNDNSDHTKYRNSKVYTINSLNRGYIGDNML